MLYRMPVMPDPFVPVPVNWVEAKFKRVLASIVQPNKQTDEVIAFVMKNIPKLPLDVTDVKRATMRLVKVVPVIPPGVVPVPDVIDDEDEDAVAGCDEDPNPYDVDARDPVVDVDASDDDDLNRSLLGAEDILYVD